MVSRARRYYDTPFKGSMGVMQGDLLSPTIFNMVVGVVIHQWTTVVDGEDTGPKGFGRASQNMAALFYAHHGILASPRPDRLLEALDVLTGFSDRVVIYTNAENMSGMVCQPCCTVGR